MSEHGTAFEEASVSAAGRALESARRWAERARDYQLALVACRRAMQSCRGSLTQAAIHEVHMYLSAVLHDDEAAAEWFEAAMALDHETLPHTAAPHG